MVVKVREIMQAPLTIDFSKSSKVAGEIMKKNRRYSIVVTKGDMAMGIVTDSDLIKKIIAKDKTPSKVKVKEIMSKPLVTVSPEEDVMQAATRMKKNLVKRLVVVDGNEIMGVIELSDVARASPEMMDLLEFKLNVRDKMADIVEERTAGICESCSNYSSGLRKISDGRWICEDCRDDIEE